MMLVCPTLRTAAVGVTRAVGATAAGGSRMAVE
jgi:hypothetical protein